MVAGIAVGQKGGNPMEMGGGKPLLDHLRHSWRRISLMDCCPHRHEIGADFRTESVRKSAEPLSTAASVSGRVCPGRPTRRPR